MRATAGTAAAGAAACVAACVSRLNRGIARGWCRCSHRGITACVLRRHQPRLRHQPHPTRTTAAPWLASQHRGLHRAAVPATVPSTCEAHHGWHRGGLASCGLAVSRPSHLAAKPWCCTQLAPRLASRHRGLHLAAVPATACVAALGLASGAGARIAARISRRHQPRCTPLLVLRLVLRLASCGHAAGTTARVVARRKLLPKRPGSSAVVRASTREHRHTVINVVPLPERRRSALRRSGRGAPAAALWRQPER